jgi:DNA-directed RNA polymerase I, II, and III subunit RPABC2
MNINQGLYQKYLTKNVYVFLLNKIENNKLKVSIVIIIKMSSYFEEQEEIIGGGDNDIDDNSSTTSSSSSDSSVDGGELIKGVDDLESDLEGGDSDVDDEDAIVDDDDDDDDDSNLVGGADSDDEKGDENSEKPVAKSGNKVRKIPAKPVIKKAFVNESSDDEDDDDEDGEQYLKKFDKEINDNYILNAHPECALQNYDEILAMTMVVRDENNIIIDDLHKTNPFLTKYERARILGQRAKQIETGATPFVKVPENMIDGYLIAELELQQGRIPFIIRRPLPNGGSEYWKINDLENIAF